MSDLLDFGGKIRYLQGLYESNVDHALLQHTTVYIFTIGVGIFTAALVLVLLSPLGRDTAIIPQGCRKYGLKGKTRLMDELSPKHSPNHGERFTVHSLWLYPIKSCQGVELEEAEIVSTGIRYDRQYSFAQLHSPFPLSIQDSKANKSAHQWRFITQREFPLLSQVQTELWVPDPQAKDYDPKAEYVKTGGVIVVRFPYEEDGLLGSVKSLVCRLRGSKATKSFTIPVQPTPEQKKTYKVEEFKIWKDTPMSLNMGVLIPPELKYFLGVRNPLSLFRVHRERELFRCAPRKESLGWQPITGFADAYPLNIMSLGSLQALTFMQPSGFPALSFRRFRGNIAAAGVAAFDEEEWQRISIGDGEYHVCCRCVRCGVPNIDPATGVKNKQEPYKTLITKRNVDVGSPKLGCLGMQMVPVKPEGVIRLGDEIKVLEFGDHVYEEM